MKKFKVVFFITLFCLMTVMVNAQNYSDFTYVGTLKNNLGSTIDVGTSASPAFADFTGDGTLDLLIGEDNWLTKLNHYTQDSEGALTFTYQTDQFVSCTYTVNPTFTDIDNDGLIDLILGEQFRACKRWEQSGVNSATFVSQTISVTNAYMDGEHGQFVVAAFADIDGDGKLDVIMGDRGGHVQHSEQSAVNGTSFPSVTNDFNSIGDLGGFTAPTFTDLDGNGLLDLIIGESDGRLRHYEQAATNSYIFTWRTNYFGAIDVGTFSAPVFTDLDGDNKLDLIIGNANGQMYHYEGDNAVPESEPPTVTVTVPNGGEEWNIEGTYQIQWTASDNVGVTSDSVFYSSDNGANWIFIETHTGNPQSCYWNIPDDQSDLCLIKVIVHDASGNSAFDISDAAFSIIEPPFQLCESFECDFLPAGWDTTYVVTPPSAGDYIQQKEYVYHPTIYDCPPHTGNHTVRFGNNTNGVWPQSDMWLFTPLVSIQSIDSLFYYIASFSTMSYPEYYEIYKCSSQDPSGADDMLFSETVNWRPMQRKAIELSAYAGTDIYLAFRYRSGVSPTSGLYLYLDDVSLYSTFDTTPPSVTVNTPNGGEQWMVGNTYQIEWTTGDDLGVYCDSVFYSTDNGSNWSLVANHSCAPQSCEWTIPDEISDQCLIKVFVQDNGGNSAYDISDLNFSIVEYENQQFVNCDFETGDLSGWEITTLYSPTIVTREGSYCCHMDVTNYGYGIETYPEPNTNDRWIWAKQTLFIPVDTDYLYFDLEVVPYGGGATNGHAYIWIRESDGTWNNVYECGNGNIAWANHQVDISAWANSVVTIYLAAGSLNGWTPEKAHIYFDNVYISEASSVPPTVPQNVTVSISGGLVTLNWDFVTGETYNIYSSTDPYAADWGAAIATGIEVGNWSESVPGVDTFYRVTATR